MLLGVINSLKTGTYVVTRTADGSYDAHGRYATGSSSTFNMDAVVQPYGGGRKMLPLPEGVRAEDVRLIHTATALRTRDNAGEADSVAIGGENYSVYAVEGPYTLGPSTHYQAYAARRGKP